MNETFIRTAQLLGDQGFSRLSSSVVAVFGLGGVGSHCAEALARSGVGALDLIDDDKVCITNLNRQILATRSTVAKYKVDVARDRILDINPNCQVTTHQTFFMPDTADQFDFSQYDYVVDAIDTVTGKKEIILRARAAGVPVISSMGAGNKVEASAFKVADIYKTSVCPLARVMRRICRQNGIDHLKVVYSEEKPIRPLEDMAISCRAHCVCPPGTARKCTQRRDIPGSTPFAVAAAGMIIAGEVVKDLTAFDRGDR